MAPAVSVVLGAELAGSGVTILANGQLALVGILTALFAFLLLSLLLIVCASCQGQKKANGHPGDHETLMNGVSEKDVCSQSAESQGTDLAASSSHNGPLTTGTVLTDTMDTSPHPSEEMLSSQSELRSSKCPQDRELPSIPPVVGMGVANIPGTHLNGPVTSDPQVLSNDVLGDGTYAMVRDGAEVGGASRDVSAEDSLYETVKEPRLPNGIRGTPEEDDDSEKVELCHTPMMSSAPPLGHTPTPPLLNGHLTPTATATPSPATPDRGPLVAGVEYASIDLNKKSRYSADLEARRRSPPVMTPDPRRPDQGQEEEEEEEEKPPPIPDKVLDENDNQQTLSDSMLLNGQLPSPASPISECVNQENHVTSNNELSQLYSSVVKSSSGGLEDPEGDYSCIGDLHSDLASHQTLTNDLYATVKDVFAPVPTNTNTTLATIDPEAADPGYETIRIPRSGNDNDDNISLGNGQLEDCTQVEPDYESVGELGLSRETSRL